MSLSLATTLLCVMTAGSSVPLSPVPNDALTAFEAADPSIPQDAAPLLPGPDQRFLHDAVQDNLAAIAALRVLVAGSGNETLHRYARSMLDDRSALQQSLEVLAIRKNVTLPLVRSAPVSPMLRELGKLSGAALDRAWIQRYGNLAQRTTTRFEGRHERVQDLDIRAFAETQAVVMQRHAQAASRAIASCGCGKAGAAETH